MKARWWIASLVAIIGIVLAATYVLLARKTAPQTAETVTEPVVETELSLQAVLQPAITIPVGVSVQGRIEAFHVEVGDEVYEGQLIAQIRSEAMETAKLEAETDLERAETRVQNLEASLSAARLEASRASADASRAKDEFERASKLFQREKMLLAEGATPRRTFEKAQKEYLALEGESTKLVAVAAAAEERISTTQSELDAARKLLEGKVADLEGANQRLGSGDILSPASGIVVSRRGQPGDEAHPSMTDLFLIASDLSLMHAVADVPPNQVGQLKKDQQVTVSIVEMGGELLQGSVLKVEDGKVTVEFANPNAMIKPGLTAQIRIKLT